MSIINKYKLKQMLRAAIWVAAGFALFILLLSAMRRNNELRCAGMEISIEGDNEIFINEAEIKKMLEDELSYNIQGATMKQLRLRDLEKLLHKHPWIKQAQLYIDNQRLLHVQIAERLPVARIFTKSGQSFYIDSSAVKLPLSESAFANVPVFTNMPDRSEDLSPTEYLLWKQISVLGEGIKKDSFLLLQIGQIKLTPQFTFEMFPVMGNHVVEFGTAENYEEKLKRLSGFYKKILVNIGFNKYEKINLQYANQVVATIRGSQQVNVDSVAASKKFEEMVNRTEKETNDSVIITAPKVVLDTTKKKIQTSEPKKEAKIESIKKPEEKNIKKTEEKQKITQEQPAVKKPVVKSAVKPKVKINKQPKAVMQKENDY